MRPHDRPSKEELMRVRAHALWIQQGCPKGRDEEILRQAEREIEREAQTLEGEPEPRETRPARLA